MKKSITRLNARLCVSIALLAVCASACGGKTAEGGTYAGNGGVIRVEFKSDGKAFLSMGPVTTACTYSESGKTLTLTCEGETTEFTVDDDGALNGPPDGMLARLTKEK